LGIDLTPPQSDPIDGTNEASIQSERFDQYDPLLGLLELLNKVSPEFEFSSIV
jgi:hypothetical protein